MCRRSDSVRLCLSTLGTRRGIVCGFNSDPPFEYTFINTCTFTKEDKMMFELFYELIRMSQGTGTIKWIRIIIQIIR